MDTRGWTERDWYEWEQVCNSMGSSPPFHELYLDAMIRATTKAQERRYIREIDIALFGEPIDEWRVPRFKLPYRERKSARLFEEEPPIVSRRPEQEQPWPEYTPRPNRGVMKLRLRKSREERENQYAWNKPAQQNTATGGAGTSRGEVSPERPTAINLIEPCPMSMSTPIPGHVTAD